jgi:MoaA/NifB/PqqE/SkfB family radical SAM enzyme
MNSDIYSSSKFLHHPDRLAILKAGGQPPPVHVQLIISDYCTHDCAWCAYRMSGYSSNEQFQIEPGQTRKARNPKRFIPFEKCLEIIDDAVDLGVRCIQFTGGGEPCIHPEFVRIAQYSLDRGLETALVTNGSMLHKPEYRAVINQMAWVRISIDAGTPETYCETRGVGRGMWDSVIQGIEDLCKESTDDTVVGIGYVATPQNWTEMHDGVKLFKSLGVDNVRLGLMFNPEGSKPFEEFRYDLAYLALKAEEDFTDDNFTVINRVSEKMDELDAGSPTFKTCHYQHLTTYVGGNQVVYRCCVNAYNQRGAIGSIHNRRFKDLWESQEKQANMANFDSRSCERCQFTEIINNIDDYIKRPPIHVDFV